MSETVNLSLDDAEALSLAALKNHGANDENARAVTDIMIRAERDRCASHGLFRLNGYCASLKSGKVNGNANPHLEVLSPGTLKVDADGGFAPLPLEVGLPALARKARDQGIAALGIVDMYHFAALWPEVETLAEQGLCAFAFTQASPMVAPAGGSKPFFGTNPIAFAWPRPGKDPFVFDQATAAMARGEIMIHARDGHEVPPGTGVDKEGNPTTDPNAILEGAQLPFGGYKGSNLSLMVELLASGLIGAAFSTESGARNIPDGGPTVGGESVIAMDPSRFGDSQNWADHCESLFGGLEEMEGVRLPGERRRIARKETPEQGINLPKSLYDQVVSLG